ncbi:MAG: DUF86 domain-containing protein [Bacteroidaceae bacterium]|nr:DUF86 domain-containing protein [Bacteroidaceae bacterium]
MRERIKDIDRLQHMLESIEVLLESRHVHSLEDIVADRILFHGYVKEVEIIGEAAYKLTKEFRESHLEIEWDDIIAMRHVLVHGYYQVSPDKLWDTVIKDLEPLRPIILRYINELTA